MKFSQVLSLTFEHGKWYVNYSIVHYIIHNYSYGIYSPVYILDILASSFIPFLVWRLCRRRCCCFIVFVLVALFLLFVREKACSIFILLVICIILSFCVCAFAGFLVTISFSSSPVTASVDFLQTPTFLQLSQIFHSSSS